MRSPPDQSNYILFSDVHLGADLVQHVRPWTAAHLKQVARIDRDLATMLDHYRTQRDPDRPWKLIIAGDLVDFVGMSIAPDGESSIREALTREERAHGLGSRADHAAAKMRAVARRHRLVFERLGAFVREGNSLVLVRGNHDVDFHWPSARDAFVEAILGGLEDEGDPEQLRQDIASRIEFHPWFYYETGLLYVEHGHQFDAMCSYPHLLEPVSPIDPTRISWSFSDILLRSVVQPTRGLGSHGHEDTHLLHYVRFGLSLGLRGAARLGYRYVAAVARALRRWRAHSTAFAQTLRERHERGMAELAARKRLGVEQVRALAALWPRPVTKDAWRVLRSVFLDQLIVGGLSVLSIVAMILMLPAGYAVPLSLLVLGAVGPYLLWSLRLRAKDIDPAATMLSGARAIARELKPRFVVMGHTHEPALIPVDDGATYVNLGHWETDSAGHEPPRTHLVLRWIDGQHRAEFLRWVPGQGPDPMP